MINYFNTDQKLDITSRSIRDISYNLLLCNYRMDPICNQFIDYTLDNWEHVTGSTVEKVFCFEKFIKRENYLNLFCFRF